MSFGNLALAFSAGFGCAILALKLYGAMASTGDDGDELTLMEYKFMRLCPKCRIRWMATMETRSCPKCAATPFLTMNAGDIGTCMQMDAAGLTLEDFPEWQAPPEETPNAAVTGLGPEKGTTK